MLKEKLVLSQKINNDNDIVLIRQRSKRIAQLLGFGKTDIARIATAVSEITRNAYLYAKDAKIDFFVNPKTYPFYLLIVVKDSGKVDIKLDDIFQKDTKVSNNADSAIKGPYSFMDEFFLESEPGKGTEIRMIKYLPKEITGFSSDIIESIINETIEIKQYKIYDEFKSQNDDIMLALNELQDQKNKLEKLNQELFEQKNWLSIVLSSIGDAIIATDKEGKITYINAQAEKLTGYSIKEIEGQKINEAFYFYTLDGCETPLPDIKSFVQPALVTVKHEEARMFVREDKNIFISYIVTPIKDENENLFGLVMIFKDISNEIETKNTLKRQALIFKTISDAIIVADNKGNIIDWNPGAEKLFGFETSEATGKSPDMLHRKNLNVLYIQKIIEKVQKEGKWEGDLSYTRKDGSSGITRTLVLPLKDNYSMQTGIISVSYDITELLKAKEELIKAKNDAEKASEAKSTFLANMSHELRTPLNAIMGISQMMMKYSAQNLTEKQIESLEMIYQSGNRLLELINDILDLSKIETGKIDLHYSTISINIIISDKKKIVENLISNKNIAFKVEKLNDVPDLIISDEKKLRQILVNLLSNASKFTEEGEIVLRIYTKNDKLYFEVEDTGIGIQEDSLLNIFDEFRQIDSSISKKYKGTGLGLALCKKLVHLLGGEITVSSTYNKGTTVKFFIPLKTIKKEKTSVETQNNINSIYTKNNNYNILVIKDKDQFIYMYEKYLKQSHYNVYSLSSVDEGIQYISTKQPDIVVINKYPPEIEPHYILSCFTNNELYSNLKFIIITNTEDTADYSIYNNCIKLIKPISGEEITNTINKLLLPETLSASENRLEVDITHPEKKKTLLIADDDEFSINKFKMILENYFDLIFAEDGINALEKYFSQKPDLVLMDIMIPKMSGFEAFDIIMKSKLSKKIPIIAVTARAMVEEKENILNYGFDGYIAKPINEEDLLKVINNILST
jgi:hypothetical protein